MSTTINANQSYFSDYNAFTSIKLNDDTFTPTNNSYSNSPGTDNANDYRNKNSFTVYSDVKDFYFQQRIEVVGNERYVFETIDLYYIIPIKDIEVKRIPNKKK